MSKYLVQLYALFIKIFLRKLRSPILTAFEVLFPSLFILVLSFCYWESPIVKVSQPDYSHTPIFNTTVYFKDILCLNQNSKARLNYHRCIAPPSELSCFSLIGNGEDLCYPSALSKRLNDLKFMLYNIKGAQAIPSMDAYLIESAIVTQLSGNQGSNFLGHNTWTSYSHYGKLLVSSDNPSLAQEFMRFCAYRSGMCELVLHPTIFPSLESAQDYAVVHSGEVWAIVHLPNNTISKVPKAEFTISMNFTATPTTYVADGKPTVGEQTGIDYSTDILYLASGFSTLQSFVQEYYIQRNVAKGIRSPYDVKYRCNNRTDGTSCFINSYGIYQIPMPSHSREINAFMNNWVYFIPMVIVLSGIFLVARFTSTIVEEKSRGIRESMLIMGIHPLCIIASWFISSLLINIIAAMLATLLMKISFLKTVNFAVLLILYFSYLHQNSALCLLLSTIFFNPSLASWCGGLLVFLLSSVAYAIPEGVSAFTQTMLSFLPCTGVAQSLFYILNYIQIREGFTWSDMDQDNLYVIKGIGVMWASSAIMIVLALYLDRVWPMTIGRHEHPLFFLDFIFRSFRKKGSLYSQHMEKPSTSDGPDHPQENFKENMQRIPLIENPNEVVDPNDPETVVAFKDLRKVYISGGLWGLIYRIFTSVFRLGDRCVALDGVSFALKRGEVSVLLGPNGAGKSTLMKLATGTIRPTSGDVYIKGRSSTYGDVRSLQHIGYCSQSDILWMSLTVEEHLSFYARVKVHSFNVQHYVDKALEMIKLEEKRHSLAGTLSGGQRRRLCFAIAMVADSEVLLLDEPTAGMDFETRKFVYDAIQLNRKNCSVFISTHILEEADRLADRILIMNSGKVSGNGSPMFLKSCVKDNYKISCVLENGLSIQEEEYAVNTIIDFVRNNGYPIDREFGSRTLEIQPQSCQAFRIERHGCEMCLNLPYDCLLSTGCELFEKLQNSKDMLKLRQVSLNPPTMKDVFLFLVAEQFQESLNPLIGEPKSVDPRELQEEKCYKFHSMNAFSVFSRHFRALFIKRLNFSKRDIKLLIIQIILPLAFILLSLLIDLVPGPSQPSILLDMTMYSNHATTPSQVLFGFNSANSPNTFGLSDSVNNSALGEHYVSKFVSSSLPNLNTIQLFTEILSREEKNHSLPRMIALAPNIIDQDNGRTYAAIMFNNSYHHTVPQAINSLYNLETERLFGDLAPKIVARNAPMPLGHLQQKVANSYKAIVSGAFITLPFLLIPVYIIGYIVRERETGAHHIQCLSGANAVALWLSSFCFDMACYIITTGLTFVVFVIFKKNEYVGSDMLFPSLSVFLLYGTSSILTSYLLASFFKTPQAAQMSVLLVNFTTGFLWTTLETLLSRYWTDLVRILACVMRIFPTASFSESMKIISTQKMVAALRPANATVNMFGWTHINPRLSDWGGIGTDLVYMAGITIASIIVFTIVEYTRIKRLKCRIPTLSDNDAPGADEIEPYEVDASVTTEIERVRQEMIDPEKDSIVVQHLSKRFPGMRRNAVNDLSFGVHKGEIMCLLGPNGTGKSTTLKILAGEEVPSCGSAYINGISSDQRVSRSYIGYCPQYNPLLDNLSPVEHLWLYARLRNIREECIEDEVSSLIQELGLYPHRHTTAHALSGGNQRRLSLAISMVGRTKSVLLDEPTANMDILGRLQTQSTLKRIVRQRSVILTTHLLDEIETLADRVVLLNHGSMHCIGTLKDLKKRYAGNEEYEVYMSFPDNFNLLEQNTEILNAIQNYFRTFSTHQGGMNYLRMPPSDTLEIVNIQASAVTFVIFIEPFEIMRFVAQVNKGAVTDIPAVKYVGITQKSIENIVLMK
ncbi:unnamed protein product [Phytomonas sp. EM1]|nr:unnamed protein product [Phytomonas sp. EM1]|eukprot:CCW59582.1 unnamed protein product [Phytomonas sp. isolate EM1]